MMDDKLREGAWRRVPAMTALVASHGWVVRTVKSDGWHGEISIENGGLILKHWWDRGDEYYEASLANPVVVDFLYQNPPLPELLRINGLEAMSDDRDFLTAATNKDCIVAALSDPALHRSIIEKRKQSISDTFDFMQTLPNRETLSTGFLKNFPWLRKRTQK